MFGNLSTKGSNFRNVLSSSLETVTLRVYGMEDDMIDMSLNNALSNMDSYTNHLFTVCVRTHTCVYGDNFWETLLSFYHAVPPTNLSCQLSAHPLSNLIGTAGTARHSITARDFTL